ncbi:phosphoadenosine phosphosulfate reductase family protein (plasmid) [Paenibacillus sp. S-38]|uniref:phosphoadenosine phosphosulfate reductase domain-containing protein n=1 Tax=Paenibacillus sp. S-38 TaxID=3416710 RepID=UPI003CED2A9B
MACQEEDKQIQVVTLPEGYWALSYMPELSYPEWLQVIEDAGKMGQITDDFADKMITTLKRMPELDLGQHIIVSFSGGKDSQAIFILARMRYSKHVIVPLFADTKDEWQDTYVFLNVFAEWMDIPINWADSMGIHHMLREVMPFFPKPGTRHCTKNLKMLPQRDWMDDRGYDQVRYDRQPAMLRNAKGKHKYPVLLQAPQMVSGERWQESENRASLPFDERNETLLRWTHRPVLDWTIDEVWQLVFWMQSPVNEVYLKGIKRVACAGCIFASTKEIYTLGQYDPEKLEEWVETERIIGHPRNKTASFAKIYSKLVADGKLGRLAHLNPQRPLRPSFENIGGNVNEPSRASG